MKAIVYREYGSPDVLRCEDVDKPAPADGEVLVRVRAAAANPMDYGLMGGAYILRPMTGLRKPKLRGMAPGGVSNMIGVLILVVWLYGTLVLAERRSGYVIILVASLLGSGIPVIHMMGAGLGGAIAKSSGAFVFVWTLLALGVTGLFSVILSARGLWSLQWGRSR